MARGHYDFLTWAGRAGGGENVIAYSFSGPIGAGVTGTIDLPVVAANQENTYQCLVITVPGDASIHYVTLSIPAIPWIWLMQNFITSGIFDFPGHTFGAGTIVRISVTNNSLGALTFEGTVFYVTKPA